MYHLNNLSIKWKAKSKIKFSSQNNVKKKWQTKESIRKDNKNKYTN